MTRSNTSSSSLACVAFGGGEGACRGVGSRQAFLLLCPKAQVLREDPDTVELVDWLGILHEWLREAGAVFGSAGLASAAYIYRRFQYAEQKAIQAHEHAQKHETELEKLQSDLSDLRDDIDQERAVRAAIQQEFTDLIKGDAELWRELNRSLGQIEGRIDTLLKKS